MGDSIQSPGDALLNAIGRPEYEFGMRTMAPPLAELLSAAGCHLFLAAMRSAGRLEGANSITILAPDDNAFLSGACVHMCANLYVTVREDLESAVYEFVRKYKDIMNISIKIICSLHLRSFMVYSCKYCCKSQRLVACGVCALHTSPLCVAARTLQV